MQAAPLCTTANLLVERIKYMEQDSLHKVFEKEIQDLYSAETQLVEALPKMARAAHSPDLRRGFEEHLEVTRQQKQRLEEVARMGGFSPRGKECVGMKALIEEGQEVIQEDMPAPLRDAALIVAAQKVEHYEIASYGSVRTYAEMMDRSHEASLLQQTLDEEGETDHKLSALAESHINAEALQISNGH
jgi:ferritin-like metal-binding protein YciE